MGQTVRLCVATLLLATLTSCLSIDTTIDVRRSNRLRVDLVYTVPTQLWNAGVFDEGTRFRAIPVTRYDAERVARSSNSELRRYRVKDGGDGLTVVSLRYRPLDAEAMGALFGGTVALGDSSIAIVLTDGGAPYGDDEAAAVAEIAGDNTVSLTIRHPGRLTESVISGLAVTPNGAALNVQLRDVLTSSAPITWKLSWE